MPWKTILMFSLVWGLCGGAGHPQQPLSSQKTESDLELPSELSESELQSIRRETSPRPRVETLVRISDARIGSAARSVEANQYRAAATDVDLYASLLIYADAVTRKIPETQARDRNACLKKLEQAIFKQTRTVDSVLRELPVDYRDPLGEKISLVRKIRLRALNDLLGGGKVMNPSN